MDEYELRVRFADLTEEERRVICNGCGPKGGFIPVPEFIFNACCDHHDFNYWIGCNRKQRKKADLQFLREMLRDANTYPYPEPRNTYRWLARIYYRAVRFGGVFCFHWAKRQRNRIDLNIEIAKYRRKCTWQR